jgi:hypothetical protein
MKPGVGKDGRHTIGAWDVQKGGFLKGGGVVRTYYIRELVFHVIHSFCGCCCLKSIVFFEDTQIAISACFTLRIGGNPVPVVNCTPESIVC